MVEIKPFKGLRYNLDKVKDFKLVITPPYDIISDESREKYLKQSKYNLLHIILGKGPGRYNKAARLFAEWQNKSIFIKEEKPSIYIYSEEFSINNKRIKRTGFISLVDIEEPAKGSILPHEKTMYAPKMDRLELIRYTRANFGQIFIVYEDNKKTIDKMLEKKIKEEPLINFEDDFKIRHKLWKIDDKNVINEIVKEMENKKVIIADGHHRYKAAYTFKLENPQLARAKYAMASFVNKQDGLIILPINRLVFNVKVDIDNALKKIEEFFAIKKEDEKSMIKELQKNKEKNAFGMYVRENNSYYLLILKDNKLKEAKEICGFQYKLDITILHKLILERILNITGQDLNRQTKLRYVKGSEEETLKELKNKKYQFGFFLNPTKLSHVIDTANHKELMPQKSTFFYPKVYSGLVIYKME